MFSLSVHLLWVYGLESEQEAATACRTRSITRLRHQRFLSFSSFAGFCSWFFSDFFEIIIFFLQGDEKVEENGVTVFIDPKALFYVIGTVMDFNEGDMGSEFTFINPNSKGDCGCGESFNV